MRSLLKSERLRVCVLMVVLVLSAAFGNMSQTALNAMLPHVTSDFGIELNIGQWLTTSYMLIYGITVPLVTYLTKRLSLKTLVVIASAFSIGGLLVATFSLNFWMLFVGRVCQAVSTGIVLPLMQTTAMVRFPPNQKATAMGVASIAMGAAPTVGPTLGGFMDTNFGWRSYFVLSVAIAVILLLVALFFIESEKPLGENTKFDSFSFMLSSLGFGGLLLAFSDASNFELGSPLVWAPFVLGVFCLVLFVRRQNKVTHPLISMRIFSSKNYTNSFIALNAMMAGHMGIILLVLLCVQNIGGLSSLEAGLVLLPGVLSAFFIAPLSGYCTDRIGIRPVALTAGLCLAAGSVMMVFINENTPFWAITVFQTLRTVGVSGLVSPLTSWGLSSLPRSIVTDGSSFTLASRQAAAALGTSAVVFVLTMSTTAGSVPMFGYQLAFGLTALLTVIAFVIILVRVKQEV